MSEQGELDVGEIDVVALLASPPPEGDPLDDKWPQTLAESVDVLFADNLRRGMADDAAIADAQRAVLVLANHIGGRSVYWPRGDALRTALRDREIFLRANRCGGKNKDQLAAEYGLVVRTIERIIAEQYRLGIKRRQGQLFNEEGKS